VPDLSKTAAKAEAVAVLLTALALSSCFGTTPPTVGTSLPYGACCAEFADGDKRQPGIEIVVPRGTPVIAATDGTVVETGANMRSGGYYVRLSHGAFDTYYTYLSRIDVSRGETLRRGEKIGLSGLDAQQRAVLQFGVCKPNASCLDFANSDDPAKYWANGSPQCFEPERDAAPPRERLTTPTACGGYAGRLLRPEQQERERAGQRAPVYP
jgi:hypothetical protein